MLPNHQKRSAKFKDELSLTKLRIQSAFSSESEITECSAVVVNGDFSQQKHRLAALRHSLVAEQHMFHIVGNADLLFP